MVAPQQHQTLWQQPSRRSSQVMHMSSVAMSSMIPTTSGAPTTRPYQPNQIDLTMPMFPATSMPGAMSFQSGAYGFDISAMGHYPVNQSFSINFQPPVSHPATYAQTASHIPAPVPLVREARNALPALNRSPTVKSEIPSPVNLHQFSERSPGEPFKMTRVTAEENDDGTITFSTEVDQLMRAIQSKSTNPPPPPAPVYQEPKKVDEPQQPAEPRIKARKRYPCSMPGCHKSFYQKTHLEIHTRAHTGVKPFVSLMSLCAP
jgi:hypothetical protein